MTAVLAPRHQGARSLRVLSGGSDLVLHAESTDRVWDFRWDEVERVYYVTHNPTGLLQLFADLDTAVGWTSGPTAMYDLHRFAIANLTAPFQLDQEMLRNRRALMWFAGELLPSHVDPEVRCYCGGFLGRPRGGGGWLHVDTCVECLATPTEACPDDRNTHAVCDSPRPVACDHHHCRVPGDVNALPCERGYESCSGCCRDGGRA